MKINKNIEVSTGLFLVVVLALIVSLGLIGKINYDEHIERVLDEGKTEGYAKCKADIFSELTARGYVQIGAGDQVITLIPYSGE